MNMNNDIKITLYIQGIKMFRNGGNFDVRLLANFVNSSFYILIGNVSGTTTVTEMYFSRILYDKTQLELSQMDFVDSAALEGLSSSWSTFTLNLKYYTQDNFHIGLTSIAYAST